MKNIKIKNRVVYGRYVDGAYNPPRKNNKHSQKESESFLFFMARKEKCYEEQ